MGLSHIFGMAQAQQLLITTTANSSDSRLSRADGVGGRPEEEDPWELDELLNDSGASLEAAPEMPAHSDSSDPCLGEFGHADPERELEDVLEDGEDKRDRSDGVIEGDREELLRGIRTTSM
ncbi:hypothetical protein KEM48_013979 [Puccinia striiformis f. sp. tritici PST-130]|nr:hypothetical protein KEM48_001401 [Puccinia striiformis f. sp. tritici PST-130]KAI9630483.1 hypothetical protein KEM48_013979 [Puccinia striiformis f. sp. tritici PST-130]